MSQKNLSNIVPKNNFIDVFSSISKLFKNTTLDIEINPDNSSILKRLYDLGEITIESDIAKQIISNPNFLNTAKNLSQIIEKLSWKKEIECARSIINNNFDPWLQLKNYESYNFYLNQIQEEYKFLKLSKGEKIIFLGSGPLPISLILFYKEYGIESIGIERLSEYSSLSKKVIEALGFTKNISIIHGDHFSLPLEAKKQILMIASQAVPQDEIFLYFSKVLAKNTKVFHRIVKGNSSDCRTLKDLIFFYANNSFDSSFLIPLEFEKYHSLDLKSPSLSSLVLYIKK